MRGWVYFYPVDRGFFFLYSYSCENVFLYESLEKMLMGGPLEGPSGANLVSDDRGSRGSFEEARQDWH